MREIRIYSSSPLAAKTTLILEESAARHVGQVLRMQAGQALVLFDGLGGSYPAVICNIKGRRVAVETGEHRTEECESGLHLTLWHSLCRGERMDNVIQKATELGVHTLRPIVTERSVVKLDERRREKKLAHWQKTVISACEQCGRNRLPSIETPQSFRQSLSNSSAFDTALLLDPRAEKSMASALASATDSGNLLICTGPEGGFSEAELAAAESAGMRVVSAGPRILRTETAPLAAISIAQALLGDLR